jgi:hypothetical protein
MTHPSNRSFVRPLVLAAAALACLSLSTGAGAASTPTVTASDITTLKGTDSDAVSTVLKKLVAIYNAQGSDALKPAVDPLIEIAWNELRLSEDNRRNFPDIVKVLSLSGDIKAKPLFLHILSTEKNAGNPSTAQGFLHMGHSVVRDISDSLRSTSPETRGHAALTLLTMSEFDTSGSFFPASDRTTIRSRLAANLSDQSVNVRISSVGALAYFGDIMVIPALEQIARRDTYKDSTGVYEVRTIAVEAIKSIKSKK